MTMISKGIVRIFSVLGSMKPSAGPSGSPVWTTKPSAAARSVIRGQQGGEDTGGDPKGRLGDGRSTPLDLHAVVEVSLDEVEEVPCSHGSVVAIQNHAEDEALDIGVVLDLNLHIHCGPPLQDGHIAVFFGHLIGETIHHILFDTAEIQGPRKISAAVNHKGLHENSYSRGVFSENFFYCSRSCMLIDLWAKSENGDEDQIGEDQSGGQPKTGTCCLIRARKAKP